MSPTGGSLTLPNEPVNASAKERNYLAEDNIGKSCYTELPSLGATFSSVSTTKPKFIQGSQSLGYLVGYATSEEDEPERHPIERAKKSRPKKTTVYKSAEIVASDTSESDINCPSPRQVHSSRTSLAKRKQLQASASGRHHKRATGTVPHKASYSKSDNKVGMTKKMKAKQRLIPPFASSSIPKRSNTKGGFVVTSSDESDNEGSDEGDQNGYKHDNRSTSSATQPLRGFEAPNFGKPGLKNESSAMSLPTKQLNKSRLNTLLGRIKGVGTTPKGKQLPVLAQKSATATRASTTAPYPTESLELRRSASVQATSHSDADRVKPLTMAPTTEETRGLSQRSKVIESSVSTTSGKANLISREIHQPTMDITKHGRVRTKIDLASTRLHTAAAGSSSSPVFQQRKSVPDASMVRGHKNGISSTKTPSVTQPISLLQLTLNEARNDIIDNELNSRFRAGGQDEPDLAETGPTSTPPASNSEKIPKPSSNGYRIAANNAASKRHLFSPVPTPRASGLPTAQRAQDHTQVSTSESGKSTPDVSNKDAVFSKSTMLSPGQSGQKRKLDSISGGSSHVTGTASKKPALPLAAPLKRPGNTQQTPKFETTTRSATTPRGISPRVPVKSNKSPISVTTPSTSESNSGSARPIKEHKLTGSSSSASITSVRHRGSNVATPKNVCVTSAIPHLPAHAKEAVVSKSIEKSKSPTVTSLLEAKHRNQPGGFVPISAKPDASQSLDSTEHATAAFDATKPAHHKRPSLDPVGTSSPEPSVSLVQPAIIDLEDTITQRSSKGDMHHVIATVPNPGKASSVVAIASSGESTQVAEESSTGKGLHESVSTVSRPEVISVVASQPTRSALEKELASNLPTTAPELASSKESRVNNVVESLALQTNRPVSADHLENAVIRHDKMRKDDIEMDVDNMHTTTIPVQQDDEFAETVSLPRAVADGGPLNQSKTTAEHKDSSPLMGSKRASSPKTMTSAPDITLTPHVAPPVPGSPSLESVVNSKEGVLTLSHTADVSKAAQPYFEYSVFQKIWSSEQVEEDIPATETTVRPFTNIDEANAQAQKTFQGSTTLLSDAILENSNNRDEHGCLILTGCITPFDNPTKKSHLKIWVQRDLVSRFANQNPQALEGTSFISSICYILRLFKLATQSDAEDSEDSDSDSDSNDSKSDATIPEPIRVYHAHTRPEIYTTLAAANRAARALQIELSHEKQPKDAFSKAFQEKNLRELNEKVVQLQVAGVRDGDGETGCWRSKFNACGLGGDTLELVVEKTGICGPRNL